MKQFERIYYTINKAIAMICGQQYNKSIATHEYYQSDINPSNTIIYIANLINNSHFNYNDLFFWIFYRYIKTGKCTFPKHNEIKTREISKAIKEFYKNKLTADEEFLNLLCEKIGKTPDFLNELNKDKKSYLYVLYEADKIGFNILMKIMIQNKDNKKENQFFKRIEKIKNIIEENKNDY